MPEGVVPFTAIVRCMDAVIDKERSIRGLHNIIESPLCMGREHLRERTRVTMTKHEMADGVSSEIAR